VGLKERKKKSMQAKETLPTSTQSVRVFFRLRKRRRWLKRTVSGHAIINFISFGYGLRYFNHASNTKATKKKPEEGGKQEWSWQR